MKVYIPDDPTRNMRESRSKYGNKKVKFQGMSFDSVGERDRYIFLQDAERRGEIRDLRRQVKFDLGVCSYIADFSYFSPAPSDFDIGAATLAGNIFGMNDDGKFYVRIIEDFKGGYKLPNDFRIKAKMMEERGTPIRIVKTATATIG